MKPTVEVFLTGINFILLIIMLHRFIVSLIDQLINSVYYSAAVLHMCLPPLNLIHKILKKIKMHQECNEQFLCVRLKKWNDGLEKLLNIAVVKFLQIWPCNASSSKLSLKNLI